MGIAIPRPALRAKENRTVQSKLAWHAARMAELEAQGMPRDEASSQAYAEVRKLKLDRRGRVRE